MSIELVNLSVHGVVPTPPKDSLTNLNLSDNKTEFHVIFFFFQSSPNCGQRVIVLRIK